MMFHTSVASGGVLGSWIAAAVNGTQAPENVRLVTLDSTGHILADDALTGGVISHVGLPSLTTAVPSAASFTVTVRPVSIATEPTRGQALALPTRVPPTVTGFRFSVAGLEVDQTSSVGALDIPLDGSASATGSSFDVSFTTSDSAAWDSWAAQPGTKKIATLEYLDASGNAVATVTIGGAQLLSARKGDKPAQFTVNLYAESMKLELKGAGA
jgi:hypothetical protein